MLSVQKPSLAEVNIKCALLQPMLPGRHVLLSPTKTAERIEVLFGVETTGDPMNTKTGVPISAAYSMRPSSGYSDQLFSYKTHYR